MTLSRAMLIVTALAAAAWASGVASLTAQASPAAQTHDDHEPAAHVHAEAAALKNPIAPTPASIATGKGVFDKQCVSCHGAGARGDGKSAAQLTPKPSDLTDASWKHGPSDGEIFTLIKSGSKNTSMRGFASKMTADEMWHVVNYIRSLSPAK